MPKMCEGCEAKLASFGTPTERVKRWCAACAKAHGAVSMLKRKMCEGCEGKGCDRRGGRGVQATYIVPEWETYIHTNLSRVRQCCRRYNPIKWFILLGFA